MALWEKFDAYDPAPPFTPWACGFALNKARQWVERRPRWQALLEHGLAEELARRRQDLQPEIELRLRHLEGCLGHLPRGQRSLVAGYWSPGRKRPPPDSPSAGQRAGWPGSAILACDPAAVTGGSGGSIPGPSFV